MAEDTKSKEVAKEEKPKDEKPAVKLASAPKAGTPLVGSIPADMSDNPENLSELAAKPKDQSMDLPPAGFYRAVKRRLRNPHDNAPKGRWYEADDGSPVTYCKKPDNWLRSQVKAGLLVKVDIEAEED